MKKLVLLLGVLLALWGSAYAAVNINTATKEELDALKGIGPTKAQAIVDYRSKNGPFKSVDDLKNVPGIGPKTLEDVRKDVTVTGSTSAGKSPAGAKSSEPVKAASATKAADTKSAETPKESAPADKTSPKKADTGTKAPDKKDSTKGSTSDKKESTQSDKDTKSSDKK